MGLESILDGGLALGPGHGTVFIEAVVGDVLHVSHGECE